MRNRGRLSGFETDMPRAKQRAKMQGSNLHVHDLRGTAATKFYIAEIPIRIIAEILAWSEEDVEKIIRRYVARAAATKALIRNPAKLSAKPAGQT
ncbi:MAG TPA: tyrosine-type recombinase/integrase [Xanthobacteraceae bacterium]|nr:tyrosine-type recombinase/integrase [Xanthobacteraceae bacterium]